MGRFSPLAAIVSLGLLAVACQSGGGIATLTGEGVTQQQPQQAAKPLPQPTAQFAGEKVGNGPVRVALLLPTGAQGSLGGIGQQLANAARMGMRDFGANRLQMIVKDTKGQAAEAALLAQQAQKEGAALIIGPLLSANVSAATSVAAPAGLPVLAFTSDQSRASRNTYLLSFSPEADVARTIGYAVDQGRRRIVALLPQGSYGSLVERTLRSVLQQKGGELVSVARYGRDAASISLAARSSVLATGTADAIYVPDGRDIPLRVVSALQEAGASLSGKQLLGSGQWESANLSSPLLQGALFAGANKANFNEFARRYQATYSTRPSQTAALAYDAISLASELVRRNPQAPFTGQAFQSNSGFSGATGLFRFRATGRVQRGLVINRVQNGSIVVVDQAPASF